MGIFSASHRQLAVEAFDCVFRRVTLRKCTTGLDTKLKTRISTGLLKQNKAIGGFVFRHFESISWVLTVLTVVSLVLSVWGLYNFVAFGNCNGPDSSAFCIYNGLLNPLGNPGSPSQITGRPSLENGIVLGSPSASLSIVEFGCFACPYTKSAEPLVDELLSEYDGRVNVVWKFFPLPTHPYSRDAANAAACANDQGKFAQFKQKLFENQLLFSQDGLRVFNSIASELNLDSNKFAACLAASDFDSGIAANIAEGNSLNLYGTPTFFIGDTVLVGPREYSEIRAAVEKELALQQDK